MKKKCNLFFLLFVCSQAIIGQIKDDSKKCLDNTINKSNTNDYVKKQYIVLKSSSKAKGTFCSDPSNQFAYLPKDSVETDNDSTQYITKLLYKRHSYLREKKYSDALQYSNAIEEYYKSHEPDKLTDLLMYDGLYYGIMKDYKKAISCGKKAFDYFEKYGDAENTYNALEIITSTISYYMFANEDINTIHYYDSVMPLIKSSINYNSQKDLKNQIALSLYMTTPLYRMRLYLRAAAETHKMSNCYILLEGPQSAKAAKWIDYEVMLYQAKRRQENDYSNELLSTIHKTLVRSDNIWHRIDDYKTNKNYALHLMYYGDYYSSLKDYDRAEQYYLGAMNIYKNYDSTKEDYWIMRQRVAELYHKKRMISKAISELNVIEDYYKKTKNNSRLSDIYSTLAFIYENYTNDIKKAEMYSILSFEKMQEDPNASEYVIIESLHRMYETFSFMGLKDKAFEIKNKIISLKKEHGLDINNIDILDTLVHTIFNTNIQQLKASKIAKIEDYCDSLLSITKGIDDISIRIRFNSAIILSTIYMYTGRNKKAERLLGDLLKFVEEHIGTNRSPYHTVLYYLATNCIWDKDYKKGLEFLKKRKKTRYSNHYDEMIICTIALNDMKQTEEFVPLSFKESMDFIKYNFTFLSGEQREEIVIIDQRCDLSNKLICPLFYFPESKICAEYAYNSALVSKGLLLSTGRNIAEAIMESGDSTLIANQNVLRTMQQQLQTCNDSAQIATLNRNIATLEKEISESLQAYADFTRDMDLTWRDVQKRLTDNETAVEFVVVDPGALAHPNDTTVYYGALLLNKDLEAPRFVKLATKGATDDIIRQLTYEAGREEAADNQKIATLSRCLHDSIWQPVMSHLAPGRAIHFSPVSMLSVAPLEYVTDATGTPFSERYSTYRLSSTRELCKDKSTKLGGNAVLYGGLIYDNGSTSGSVSVTRSKRAGWRYLPHTAEEVDSITSILKNAGCDVTSYKGLDGSEEAFRSMSGKDINVLHIATHGFYFNEEESAALDFFKDLNIPVRRDMSISSLMRSGLLLSGGQQAWLGPDADTADNTDTQYADTTTLGNSDTTTDGVMLSSEISLLNLHGVSHVTLSACQTALGDIGMDGIVGLQRALKMAGVGSILMTLWDVNDEATRILMTAFYRHLTAGKIKAEALRAAQQDLRHYDHGRYDDPRHWAAFILLDN